MSPPPTPILAGPLTVAPCAGMQRSSDFDAALSGQADGFHPRLSVVVIVVSLTLDAGLR
ncbi:MAG: hypothetical protein M3R15_14700 [Acidobacteriota bacterium]|nr:hypothetical protein [Acidobacteriota bacterium]